MDICKWVIQFALCLISVICLSACEIEPVEPSLEFFDNPAPFSAADNLSEPDYYSLKSTHFHLRGYITDELGQAVIQSLEELRQAQLDIYNIDVVGAELPLDVIFLEDEYYQAFQVGEFSIAFYAKSLLGPKIVVNATRLNDDYSEFWRILFHEYTHHFNASYFPYKTPIWMNEGLAENFSSFRRLDDSTYSLSDSRALAGGNLQFLNLGSHNWIAMDRYLSELTDYPILPGYYGDAAQKRQTYFYAQAWLLAHWMKHSDQGRDVGDVFKQNLEKGEDLASVFPTDIQAILEDYARNFKPVYQEGSLSGDTKFVAATVHKERIEETDMLSTIFLLLANDAGGASKPVVMADLLDVFRDDPQYEAYYLAVQCLEALQENDVVRAYSFLKRSIKAGEDQPEIMRFGAAMLIRFVGVFPGSRLPHAELTVATVEKSLDLQPGDVGLDLDRLAASGRYGQRTLPVSTVSLERVLARDHHKRNPLKAMSMMPLLINSRNFDIAEDVLDRSRIWISPDRAADYEEYSAEIREDIRLGRKYMEPNNP